MPTGPIWTWTDAEKLEYRRQNQLGEFSPERIEADRLAAEQLAAEQAAAEQAAAEQAATQAAQQTTEQSAEVPAPQPAPPAPNEVVASGPGYNLTQETLDLFSDENMTNVNFDNIPQPEPLQPTTTATTPEGVEAPVYVPNFEPIDLGNGQEMSFAPDIPLIEDVIEAQIKDEVIEQPMATPDHDPMVPDVVPDNYLEGVQTAIPDFAAVNPPVPEGAEVKINPIVDEIASEAQQQWAEDGVTSADLIAEVGGNGVESGLALGQAIADNGGITYTSEDLYTTQVVSPDQQISNALDNDNRIDSQIGRNMNARADELNFGSVQADFDNNGNIVPGTDVPLSQMDNPIRIQPEQLFPEAFEAVNNMQPVKKVGFRNRPGVTIPGNDIGAPPQNSIPLPSSTTAAEPNPSITTMGNQMDQNRWNQNTGSYGNPYAGTEAEADYANVSVLQQHANNYNNSSATSYAAPQTQTTNPYVTTGISPEMDQIAQQNNIPAPTVRQDPPMNTISGYPVQSFSTGGFVDPIPEYRGRGGRV